MKEKSRHFRIFTKNRWRLRGKAKNVFERQNALYSGSKQDFYHNNIKMEFNRVPSYELDLHISEVFLRGTNLCCQKSMKHLVIDHGVY